MVVILLQPGLRLRGCRTDDVFRALVILAEFRVYQPEGGAPVLPDKRPVVDVGVGDDAEPGDRAEAERLAQRGGVGRVIDARPRGQGHRGYQRIVPRPVVVLLQNRPVGDVALLAGYRIARIQSAG